MDIKIKPLFSVDIGICTEIICSSVLAEKYGYIKENINNMLLKALENKEKIFIANIDKDIVGLIWFDTKGTFTVAPYLKLIVIDERYKGNNIGSTLLDFYENECKETKKHYFLLVSDFNINAIKFYERKGYKQIGTIPSFVKKNINEIIMLKENSI